MSLMTELGMILTDKPSVRDHLMAGLVPRVRGNKEMLDELQDLIIDPTTPKDILRLCCKIITCPNPSWMVFLALDHWKNSFYSCLCRGIYNRSPLDESFSLLANTIQQLRNQEITQPDKTIVEKTDKMKEKASAAMR
jgi:hypothetical protein